MTYKALRRKEDKQWIELTGHMFDPDFTECETPAKVNNELKFDNIIEKANELAGGSNEQIEMESELEGVFIVHVEKDETLDFDDIAKIEIQVESEGKRFTILKDCIHFISNRIDWSNPAS